MQLSLLVLKTDQIERVRDFYAGLGLQFRKERHGTGPVHFAAEAGGIVLEIYPLPPSVAQADATTRLGFRVGALDPIIAGMVAAGVSMVAGPQRTEWGYRAVVRDPDGRCVELTQVPD
jgi:predicted enzyme related to lactoylglutathione lyase